MPVNSPPATDTRSRLADWLEILSLTKTRRTATLGDFLSLLDLLEDDGHSVETDAETGENLDGEILEDPRFAHAYEVFDELDYRSNTLKDHYPFRIEVRGSSWSITLANETENPELNAARSSYLFCLIASGIRDHRISSDPDSALLQAVPDLFQTIAVKAAAGILEGEAISFGWPRPEGSAFQPALREASERLGLGKPLEDVPLWSTGREKDAGIDIIAWRDFVDQRPGKFVLFGQVASGQNWTDKSVKNDTATFLSWFSERPTEHFIPAIFIPFPQHHTCSGREEAPFEAVAVAEAWLREQQFGLVIDRIRIVTAAAPYLVAPRHDEEQDTLSDLSDWITDALALARATM